MSSVVKFNNKVLRLNNKTVGWTAPPVLYYVTTNGVNGTVVATPNTGYNGDTITLSNTPNEGYEFDSYSLTGATLYDTNKFDINNSDVNVLGNFNLTALPEEVQIGTQIWKTKNLAIDDGGSGILKVDNVISPYDNSNFGTQYYYTYHAAMRIANTIQGWHVPTTSEFLTLRTYTDETTAASEYKGLGAYKLKSTYGWKPETGYTPERGNGIDYYGFCSIPVGQPNDYLIGDQNYFWTQNSSHQAASLLPERWIYYYANISYNNGFEYAANYTYNRTQPTATYYLSVRLIKDD